MSLHLPAPTLLLAPGVERSVERASRAARPREACGLLLGRRVDDVLRVDRATTAENVIPRADAQACFEIDPGAIVRAENEARRSGAELVGTWHSHPNGCARPSSRDLDAVWSDLALVIVALGGGANVELRAWQLRSDAFFELALA